MEVLPPEIRVSLGSLPSIVGGKPALSKVIVYGLQSFYNSQLNKIHASNFKAINNQRKMGWDNFSRGRISKQFPITMNIHYKKTQRTSTFTGIG